MEYPTQTYLQYGLKYGKITIYKYSKLTYSTAIYNIWAPDFDCIDVMSSPASTVTPNLDGNVDFQIDYVEQKDAYKINLPIYPSLLSL